MEEAQKEVQINDWEIVDPVTNHFYIMPLCLQKRRHAVTLMAVDDGIAPKALVVDPVGKVRGSLANFLYRRDMQQLVKVHLLSMGFSQDTSIKIMYTDHQSTLNDTECTYWSQHYIETLADAFSGESPPKNLEDMFDRVKQATTLPPLDTFQQNRSSLLTPQEDREGIHQNAKLVRPDQRHESQERENNANNFKPS